jgi:hypothetical protein
MSNKDTTKFSIYSESPPMRPDSNKVKPGNFSFNRENLNST